MICDGGAGMRYTIPSQVRPATHSIAASILNTCQRVNPSMNVSVKHNSKEQEKPPDEDRLHLFLFFLKEMCLNLGAGFESLSGTPLLRKSL